ncbi:MAG: tyrosine-type recombinase/integrase [Gammaproteobacteria bacterium]
MTRAGEQARIAFLVHPHMLRHGCGFKLANDGHDTRAIQHYMGHRNIQHTVRYTELAADRFNGFCAYSAEACHPFHVKAATQTGAKLPPIGA